MIARRGLECSPIAPDALAEWLFPGTRATSRDGAIDSEADAAFGARAQDSCVFPGCRARGAPSSLASLTSERSGGRNGNRFYIPADPRGLRGSCWTEGGTLRSLHEFFRIGPLAGGY